MIAATALLCCSTQLPAGAAAQAPTPSAAPGPAAATVAKDVGVLGPIPQELAGTWLVIVHMRPQFEVSGMLGSKTPLLAPETPIVPDQAAPEDKYANRPTLFRFEHQGGRWSFTELDPGKLPPELDAELDEANKVMSKFAPSDAARKSAGAAFSSATPLVPGREQTFSLRVPGYDPPQPSKAPKPTLPKGTMLIFIQESAPRGQVLARAANFYFTSLSRDRAEGAMQATSLMNPTGPALVPVGVSGDFSMYRLPQP